MMQKMQWKIERNSLANSENAVVERYIFLSDKLLVTMYKNPFKTIFKIRV